MGTYENERYHYSIQYLNDSKLQELRNDINNILSDKPQDIIVNDIKGYTYRLRSHTSNNLTTIVIFPLKSKRYIEIGYSSLNPDETAIREMFNQILSTFQILD